MTWQQVGSRWLAAPYQIIASTDRKYEVWFRDEKRYFIVLRYIDTLPQAKAVAQAHLEREGVSA